MLVIFVRVCSFNDLLLPPRLTSLNQVCHPCNSLSFSVWLLSFGQSSFFKFSLSSFFSEPFESFLILLKWKVFLLKSRYNAIPLLFCQVVGGSWSLLHRPAVYQLTVSFLILLSLSLSLFLFSDVPVVELFVFFLLLISPQNCIALNQYIAMWFFSCSIIWQVQFRVEFFWCWQASSSFMIWC